MSPIDRPIPPAGEEIHLPGGSLQPVLLAAFLTIALVGVTTWWPISAIGGFASVLVIIRWVRDARAEMAALPADHTEP